jgi:hypothetical protein
VLNPQVASRLRALGDSGVITSMDAKVWTHAAPQPTCCRTGLGLDALLKAYHTGSDHCFARTHLGQCDCSDILYMKHRRVVAAAWSSEAACQRGGEGLREAPCCDVE